MPCRRSLCAERVPLSAIAAAHGTPTYVYSRATLERHYRAFDDALNGLEHRVCYAVKANSNLAVLQVLARLGAGFDIVSGGELARVLAAVEEYAEVVAEHGAEAVRFCATSAARKTATATWPISPSRNDQCVGNTLLSCRRTAADG